MFLCAVFTSCSSTTEQQGFNEVEEEGQSVKVNGKWTVDRATAEELKGMKNTMENFTLLNKKKFENMKAYQEYGALLRNHIERVNTYCGLDAANKTILCKSLNNLKSKIEILEGNDMEKSREAMTELNSLFAQIDSTFNYVN